MPTIRELLENLRPEHKFSSVLPPELVCFVKELSDVGLIMEMPAYWYGEYFMSRFVDRWKEAQEERMPEQMKYPESIFDQVGIALKLIYAWDLLTLGLSNKKSVAHELILESANDLECSAFLSTESFSKQSLQTLRNYCESCVAIVYFQRHRDLFQAWYEDISHYHFPDYRDMVENLTEEDILLTWEKKFLHEIYTRLNSSVHNQRHRINMAFPRMDQYLKSNGLEDIEEWSRELKNILLFMLRLYSRLHENNYWNEL
jgi:hypothetical protein